MSHSNTEILSRSTGTSQYSPHQIETSINGTVVTYECDHERHVGTTEDTHFCKYQQIKYKKEALLLELQEQLHSQEQNLLIKESGTPI